ncbi:MAG: hypothetical protein ACFE85_11205 [Candidatus Hodarchaeota archaeon]
MIKISKRILIVSIVFIALGAGLIPAGILIENSINNIVANSVDEGLIGIEEEAIPLIVPMIKEKGIPRTLRGIRDVGISYVEDMVEATFVAVLIETMAVAGGTVFSTYFPPIGIETFFNNDTTGVWVIFSGVSYYHSENLNFTEDAQNRILFGNSTTVPGYIPGIQGFLNDTSTGSGVELFLSQYNNANSSETNELKENIQEAYNSTWYQLTKLNEYICLYLIDLIIPIIISNNLHVDYMPELSGLLSVNAIAQALFMEQWANGTILGEVIYPGGIDFSEILEDLNESLVGFEVGRDVPSNITRSIAFALFNETEYPNALTNDTGIEIWITAYTNNTVKNSLMDQFNLTQTQMNMILDWLFYESFQENIVPELMKLPPPDGVGMNITQYARVLFLEVWTNGTADGKVLYPFGFPLTLKAGTVYGFEIGYQDQFNPVISTNISLSSAESLWNVSNPYSLVNKQGLQDWYDAVENPNSAVAYGLMNAHNLENAQMEMILTWLPKFKDEVMPFLAQEDRNLPTDSKTLGNTIQIGTSITGGICIGLSVIGLIGNSFKKKKLRS